MTLLRATLLALLTTAAIAVAAVAGFTVPVHWAVLIGLAAGGVTLAAGLLSGTYDVDWTAEPDPAAAGVTLHATALTERLERSAIDQYRFTSRVQPRLRRLATAAVRHRTGADDLDDPRARELLGPDLHRLLTAADAQLPPAPKFTALVRRLEELCTP